MKKKYHRPSTNWFAAMSLDLCLEKDSFVDGGGASGGGAVAKERESYDMEEDEYVDFIVSCDNEDYFGIGLW